MRLAVQSKGRIDFNLFSKADGHPEVTRAAEGIVARVRLERQALSELNHSDQREPGVALLIALDPKV